MLFQRGKGTGLQFSTNLRSNAAVWKHRYPMATIIIRPSSCLSGKHCPARPFEAWPLGFFLVHYIHTLPLSLGQGLGGGQLLLDQLPQSVDVLQLRVGLAKGYANGVKAVEFGLG